MKYKLIILFSFFTNFILAQEVLPSKNIKVTYTHSMFKGTFIDDCTLIINNSIAQFQVNKKKQKKKENGLTYDRGADNYINNYNLNTKSHKEQRVLERGGKIFAEWDNDLNWEITNETKVISGYNVIKATTDSYEIEKDNLFYQGKAIAWFATDIPFSAGPGRYVGLPGLILEVEYENSNAIYKLKSIEFDSSEEIKEINGGKKVEKHEVLHRR